MEDRHNVGYSGVVMCPLVMMPFPGVYLSTCLTAIELSSKFEGFDGVEFMSTPIRGVLLAILDLTNVRKAEDSPTFNSVFFGSEITPPEDISKTVSFSMTIGEKDTYTKAAS